jgi:hypothetical protein
MELVFQILEKNTLLGSSPLSELLTEHPDKAIALVNEQLARVGDSKVKVDQYLRSQVKKI